MRQQFTSNSFATLTSRFGAMAALLLSFLFLLLVVVAVSDQLLKLSLVWMVKHHH